MFDTLIYNGTVVAVDEAFTALRQGAVAISGAKIERVWPLGEDDPLPPAREAVDARGGIIMPGLVNTHTHLPMSLFRGLADDLPLMTWLNDHIFPAEARHLSAETVGLGTRLSCAEMLLGGITTCCDGYFLADHVAEAVREIGMRAVVAQGVIDFPAPGVPDPARNVAHAREFARRWAGRAALLRPSVFCHSPYACSADTLRASREAADELGALFQIHVAETRGEVERCRSQHGCSPVRYLLRLGVLSPDTLLVHAVWVDEEDIEIIASSGAAVAHCPESNMKLGAGIAPIPALLEAGVTVGLGTDGCASNNDLDLFGEMDMAAKLHKVQRNDPTVMDAVRVVRMATIEGARALGLQRQIGSLEAGKQADLIVIDLDQPHLTPLYHPASHLVYAANGADVRHVMIDGRWLVRDRQLQGVDLSSLLSEASAVAKRIADG